MGLTKQQLTAMIDYQVELQAFVDAAASFTEPALGHHKAWAEAVARARVALAIPKPSATNDQFVDANKMVPITPPPELVQQWRLEHCPALPSFGIESSKSYSYVATQAARWGADMELEACCEWLRESLATPSLVECFLANRRPKPPSLKELALEALDRMDQFPNADDQRILRRALEQLSDD